MPLSRDYKDAAQMAAEISFKPWFIPLGRSASGLIRKGCGSVGVSRKTFVILDEERPRNGLTFFVDMCPGKLPNSLFFDSWPIPRSEITAGAESNRVAGEIRRPAP
jgi:hypothetical protein